MTTINFTYKRLMDLTNETDDRLEFSDSTQKGLRLRVHPGGIKTFRLRAWDRRRKRTVQTVIGRFPDMSIGDARQCAADLISDINKGVDVIGQQNQARDGQTVNDLFELWLDQVKGTKKTWQEDENRYNLYIRRQLGGKRLVDLTPETIQRWRIALAKAPKERGAGTISPATINRAYSIISAMFNRCAAGMPNPCRAVPKYRERSRDRFLSREELDRLFIALQSPATPDHLRDFVLLSLYVGARRSNMLAMTWRALDLDLCLWMIAADESKHGDPLVIPLPADAVEILQRRKELSRSPFVFPGRDGRDHLKEPKRAWKTLLKRAGIDPDTRLHDLRRTLGSYQAIAGSSTKLIGASLGHKSDQATAVYSRLTVQAVRESMERAIEKMKK